MRKRLLSDIFQEMNIHNTRYYVSVFVPLLKIVRNTIENLRVNVDLNNINTTIKFVMKSAKSFIQQSQSFGSCSK